MTTAQIKNILQQPYHTQRNEWRELLKTMFRRVDFFETMTQLFDNQVNVRSGGQFGIVRLADGKNIALFEIEVTDKIEIAKNRVALREIAIKYIDQNLIHGALVFYYDPNQREYRLSFMARQSELTEGGSVTTETQPKRFTYLLGETEPCTTAAQRMAELVAQNQQNFIGIKNIIEAFSVEKLSKDFFKGYRDKYYSGFIAYLTGENADGKRINEPHLYLQTVFQNDKKAARDFVKKLLGRLVFMHFLQKKGWLGCPNHIKEWENGDPAFLQNLFANCPDKTHFLTKYLNELFFNTLNNDRKTTNYIFTITNTRVPYLNGGLFDRDKLATHIIDFPPSYFEELLAFFEQYNFTIDENDPDEQEVGIDPEMLGHIFENLLEDNKDKGAFYTPKEIVQYMCQESLIQYLKTHLATEGVSDEVIAQFVRHRKVTSILEQKAMAQKVHNLLKELKICDPAIGSGAFPIGLLQEIYKARLHIYPFLRSYQPFSPAKVKKEIIQHAIYGVDKDGGAVDIARLRFWLALVVDEIMPEPLPNLDFKIMQGDSLLESFEGIPLDKIVKYGKTQSSVRLVNPQFDIFGNVVNAQTQFFIHDTEGGIDFQKLLDEYFEATNQHKTKLYQQIDKFVLTNIHYNLETHKDNLQIRLATAQKKLDDKLKSLNNEAQRQKLKEGKDAQAVEKLRADMNTVDAKFEHLKTLQQSPERPFFLWHTYFKDVFEKGGFDIVIGNPPYVQLQKMGETTTILEKAGYESFERTGDIYCLFYELGNSLLKRGGILNYITSNKWMRAGYGESLRKYFLAHTDPKILLDFGGVKVFENATVDVNILLFKKGKYTNHTTACLFKSDFKLNSDISVYIRQNAVTIYNFFADSGWVILSQTEMNIKQKIEKIGKPLKDWDIQINYGIKTGFNEAFIIDGKTKDALIAKSPKNAEIIRPILRGRDIKKYKADFADLWLIATFPSLKIDIEEYPDIKNHLLAFGKKRLEQSGNQGSRKKTNNKWFEVQDTIGYYECFIEPKIIWKRIGSILRFSYEKDVIYTLDSTCFLVGNHLYYLLAILNSNIGFYQLLQNSPKTGTGDIIISVQALEPIYIPLVSDKDSAIIEENIHSILYNIDNDIPIDKIEKNINNILYKIYNFEKDEIENIEYFLKNI